MVTREKIDELVNFLNTEIKRELGDRLESSYIVGSYTKGNISLTRPDINWLLIHKDPVQDITRWKLGEVLTNTIDHFISDFVVRPEPRPFKFSYPVKRGKNEVFVNFSIATNAPSPEEFKRKNFFLPEYVLEGFKASRGLIFGSDVLKKINFEVTKKSIHEDAPNKISAHKIQLDRIPMVYHFKRDVDLIFNETLSHGKNLLYFGVELLMSEDDLKQRKFLDVFNNSEKLIDFYKARFPEALNYAEEILAAKENFEARKNDIEMARNLYLAVSSFSESLYKKV